MNCPRCDVALEGVEISGLQIDLCPRCEGSFYDHAELQRAFSIPDRQMKSSKLLAPGQAVDLEKPVACPRCAAPMERDRYLSDCAVLIDRCPEHGIWLDGGELQTLLDYLAESIKKPVGEHARDNPGGFLQALRRLFGG